MHSYLRDPGPARAPRPHPRVWGILLLAGLQVPNTPPPQTPSHILPILGPRCSKRTLNVPGKARLGSGSELGPTPGRTAGRMTQTLPPSSHPGGFTRDSGTQGGDSRCLKERSGGRNICPSPPPLPPAAHNTVGCLSAAFLRSWWPGIRGSDRLCARVAFRLGLELWAWAAGWHQGLCLARRNWWGKLSQKWGYPGPTKQKRLFPPDEAQSLTTSWIACLERSPSGDRRAQVHPGSHQDEDERCRGLFRVAQQGGDRLGLEHRLRPDFESSAQTTKP